MKKIILFLFVLINFAATEHLLAQNGICETGESPGSPDCNGVCDPGDEPGSPDCNGVCEPGDSSSGPDCNGVCDPGDHPSSPDCLILPIELSSFRVTESGDQILLEWETKSEVDNEWMIIERSIDGQYFTAIGKRKGSGNSTLQQNYYYEDKNPVSGINYYRLKQIDTNEQFSFSNIQSIVFKKRENFSWTIYPNPSSSGLLNIRNIEKQEGPVNIFIYNMSGDLLYQNSYTRIDETNELQFDLSSFLAGIHVAKIKSTNSIWHRKFIIN